MHHYKCYYCITNLKCKTVYIIDSMLYTLHMCTYICYNMYIMHIRRILKLFHYLHLPPKAEQMSN